jgi:site-specific DNA-methyltransferase (adenine-specific)
MEQISEIQARPVFPENSGLFTSPLFMYSHGITRDTFAFIPILDMTKSWSDKKLYKRYALAESEIAYIESRIRPMEANGE